MGSKGSKAPSSSGSTEDAGKRGSNNSNGKKTKPSKKQQVVPESNAVPEDIRDKYELGVLLGSGSFGQVREAKLMRDGRVDPGAPIRAVKMIECDEDSDEWSNRAIFMREVGLLQLLNHDNIIRFYDFYEDHHFLYVVMELCKGGEVFAKIGELKKLTEKQAATLGLQMFKALDYVHQLDIVHRDLKAENFMLSEPALESPLKMIDFGMACKCEEGQVLKELCGSPHYIAPELIGQKYNHMCDVWSLGVLLYLLMYGRYPYDAKHARDIMVKIVTEPIKWPSTHLSHSAHDFLARILVHDPRKRLKVQDALVHSWMKTTKQVDSGKGLDVECIRSAQKKLTDTRKIIDPRVEEERTKKLAKLNKDFNEGVRHGHRLGETPKEEFMDKPECVRRDNKLVTAPSAAGTASARRGSVHKLAGLAAGLGVGRRMSALVFGKSTLGSTGSLGKENLGILPTVGEEGATASAARPKIEPLSQALSAEASARKPAPIPIASGARKRLSYIGDISCVEEQNLASLYEEREPEMPAGQQAGGENELS